MWQRFLKALKTALAWWLSLLEYSPLHQKAAGSIPGQGTYLSCRFDSPVRVHLGDNQSMFITLGILLLLLHLFLLFLSL